MSDVPYHSSFSPDSILLVEDDDAQREAAVEMLVFMGHDVLSAASGEDALELLKATKVAVLVTDLELPGMSGVELATQAANLDPEIQVVFTSGKAYLVSAPLPFDFSLVAKPYHYATLQDKLNHLGANYRPEDRPEGRITRLRSGN